MISISRLFLDALIGLVFFGAIYGLTGKMKNMAVDAHKTGMTSYSDYTKKLNTKK